MTSRFTRTREDFVCEQCGRQVRGNGYTNHCPQCLWSKHVDVNPGDRAATCGGLMEPVAAIARADEVIVTQQCTRCGRLWRNKAAPNDRRETLLSLFGKPVVDEPSGPPGSRRADRSRHRRRGR